MHVYGHSLILSVCWVALAECLYQMSKDVVEDYKGTGGSVDMSHQPHEWF